jgi:hypothetical protein
MAWDGPSRESSQLANTESYFKKLLLNFNRPEGLVHKKKEENKEQ